MHYSDWRWIIQLNGDLGEHVCYETRPEKDCRAGLYQPLLVGWWEIFPKSSEHILQQDRQTYQRCGGRCFPSARPEVHLLCMEEIHAKQRFSMLPMTETHPLSKHLQSCLSVRSSWTLPFLACYSKLKIKDLCRISEMVFNLVLIVLYEAGII